MTDEQYAAALAQYEKEVAAYETAAANDYSATDASVVWDGGWRQTSNQSYKIPLIKKDGGFTVVKIQVGVANNYKAQADATIDEKIGTVKTYTFLIGQKYKNTDADIDIYIDGNLLKNPEKVGDEIIYRYGIVNETEL